MITKLTLIRKICQIMKTHNRHLDYINSNENISMLTLAPAKEIADYVFKKIEELKSNDK